MVEESRHALRRGSWSLMNTSTTLARTIVRQILEAGITDVVISPGSRNAPLTMAFFEASERKLITLHTRIDERTAAFFALGITKATNRPVPIICTSGTAVANYHPAVLEASHSNLPLLVITADRPAELRRTGANQTTDQARIFGKAVRYFADISGAAYPMVLPLNSLKSGPVHLNVQFAEPLGVDGDSDWLANLTVNAPRDFDRKSAGTFYTKSTRGILVVGHDRGGLSVENVEKFAADLGWPLIAEDPLSFKNALSHASIFLTSQTITDELAPDTVVVIGRTTLSRSINRIISRARKSIVIDPRILTVDSDRTADQKFSALPVVEAPQVDGEYLERWHKFSQRSAKKISELSTWSEALIAREIGSGIPTGTSLFISSSRPIRDIEGFAVARSGVETFANRGLAGIDGNISTALGIASQRKETIAVLGDLSFLHDITGLIHDEKINLKIIVIDNNGGGIFSTLAHRGVAGFESIFGTPHNLDLTKIAAAFGLATSRVTKQSELITELSMPVVGLSLVVVSVPDRESNADNLQAIYNSVDSI
jgi:2-succinyl-5-enolpyruvyl-6-hydroxy-3-cyclohexene-1-carboxylate synthase